jgi:predicted Zn-dependent protease
MHKQTTRALARAYSGSTVLSLMVIDSGGTPAHCRQRSDWYLQYRRDAEEEADLDSVPPLAKAGISANGLVMFLRRLEANPYLSEPSQYLSSHPALLDRANGLQQEARKMAVPAGSLMAAEQWFKARAVCAAK